MDCSPHQHYESLLAEHYSWMQGDFEDKAQENLQLFRRLKLHPGTPNLALDLGSGPGYQTLALRQLGWNVTAFDFSRKLLDELKARPGLQDVAIIEDNIVNLTAHYGDGEAGLIVCMGDTITHLLGPEALGVTMDGCSRALAPGGHLVLSFREQVNELKGADRIIPLRADDSRIMSVFLEYFKDRILVHDMIWQREQSGWTLKKSAYTKLRLTSAIVKQILKRVGLRITFEEIQNGLTCIVAERVT